ncbi:ankyrin repeat-containing protein ITN1-like [Eucalyptus grandis]|uniref:ankyrin repeat-containing protein ITN1-like n=1 Tax=Eucalyptus grandis TaxID=71139 RepID=UPI00192EAF76|nr:ankyrin repeat-containing protein ITN1-like [Eucalyptus grandis]
MHPKVYEAAKSGDCENLMTIILGNGEDLFHQTTPKHNNILHVAAQYQQVNFIKDLLQCPSGPPLLWQGNYKGDTPLHIAAKVGSCKVIRVFTDLAKSMHWVVQNGQVDLCKELLRKPNSNEGTALHYAARGGHVGVVKLLIEEDSQLCDITNAADESPLYLAANRGLSHAIEIILGASSLSSSRKGPKGLTALHAAIFHLPTGWWKILEKTPEVIKEGDDLGRTPLHYVACFGEVKAVRLLLHHDTSVAYDLDKGGESALHIAAFQGHINVIDELIRSCPDACDIINTEGQTALHAAIMGGQVNVVKYILKMPNLEDLINEQDINGNTALHLAALKKKYNIIYILAQDKRVDRLATNKDHLTALDIFAAHDEVGYRAVKVLHVLKGSYGIQHFQDWVTEYVKKRLDKQFVEGQPVASTTMGINTGNRENFDSSKRSIIDLQQLVAVLIATVTFAAAFTMPGGYFNDGPDQGMPILADRPAFKAFVIFNTTAFCFSILALFLLYDPCFWGARQQARYAAAAGCYLYFAICGLVLAFACGTYVVLTRTNGLGIVLFVVFGCLLTMHRIGVFLDPEAGFWKAASKLGRVHGIFTFLHCQPSSSSTFMSAVRFETPQSGPVRLGIGQIAMQKMTRAAKANKSRLFVYVKDAQVD